MLGRITAFWVEAGQKTHDLLFPDGTPRIAKKWHLPKFTRILHSFNFILLHCEWWQRDRCMKANIVVDTYMIFMSLLGSVILYGIGGMAYIDALFFATGAATQSGLNT
jgi:hypothetical protein